MIPNELIEKALSLTGKTMEDMEIIELEWEYVEYQIEDWYDERYIQTPVSVFSIEKFCYYLCSREFLSKYYIWPYKYPDRNEIKELIGEFGYAIMDYQDGMEEPLISLLEKI